MTAKGEVLIWYKPAQDVQMHSKFWPAYTGRLLCQAEYYLSRSPLALCWVSHVADMSHMYCVLSN